MSQEVDLNVSVDLRQQSSNLWKESLEKLIAGKTNMILKTRAESETIIDILRKSKRGVKKERKEYHILNRYRFEIDDDDKYTLLTQKGNRVPIKEDLFDLLYRVHKKKGHGGTDVMYNSKVLKKYEGITKELIVLFLQCCQSCQLKKNKVRKNVTVQPIISTDFNTRCQMDLIDLQSKPDGEFKFILNYQDHFTKYCWLRPLKFKNAEAVATQLKLIICDIGPCKELQTDNGREFSNSTIEALVKQYGGKLIHGKARHSQSQGSIERSNRDVQNILTILMRRRNSKKWSELLPDVQLMKNSRYHSGIKNTPYKALYGRDSVYEDDFEQEFQDVEEKRKEDENDEDSEEKEDSEGKEDSGGEDDEDSEAKEDSGGEDV